MHCLHFKKWFSAVKDGLMINNSIQFNFTDTESDHNIII